MLGLFKSIQIQISLIDDRAGQRTSGKMLRSLAMGVELMQFAETRETVA